MEMSKQFDGWKHLRIHFWSKNMRINMHNLGIAVGFGSSSSINGSNEMLGCESLSLSRVRSIKDGALIFRHVIREEKASRDLVGPMVDGCLRCRHSSTEVHCYNSSDERLRLNHF